MNAVPRRRRWIRRTLIVGTVVTALTFLASQPACGGSATWNLNPGSGTWNVAANWTPNTVPNGPADVATFGASNTTGITLDLSTQLSGLVFNPGASVFTLTANGVPLTLSGTGISNNSGATQNFVGDLNGSSAGSFTFKGNAPAPGR